MQGYLVSLGPNGQLDNTDVIGGAFVFFTSETVLGTGEWTWSGTAAGTTYTNEVEPGDYHLASNGNIYFIPQFGAVSSITSATSSTPVAYDPNTFGTTGNNTLLGDAVSDFIYGGATTSATSTGNDTINAGAGNDTVFGGDGDDRIEGSGNNDSISGGSGNDTIYGDNATAPTATSEHLSWIAQGATGTSIINGFTQDTGSMNVSVGFVNNGSNTGAITSSTTQYVGSGPYAATSGLNLTGGAGPNVTATMSFTAEAGSGLTNTVSNVSFIINDVDMASWQDIITVLAYDINGNLIPVTITPLGNDTVSGNTITAANTSDAQNGIAGAVQITVAGPVHAIEVIYSNGGTVEQALWLTDVYFTTIPAADGNDSIDAGSGNDVIYGGGGNDVIQGGAGTDSIYGGTGGDTINDSGTGTDFIFGGDGNDVISAGLGNDTVQGGDGADSIYGGDGADSIDGGIGNDSIFGGSGADLISGGTGDDSIVGELGNDIIYGGTGNDYVDGDAGDDTLFGDDGNDVLVADAGNDTLFGGTGDDGLYASEGNNTAYGEVGNDSIFMGTGNDTLFGGTGNDTLSGGAGNDTLTGGADNDSIAGGTGSDRIILADGFGQDTIRGDEDAGNTETDILDGSSLTNNTTVVMSGPEAGTLTSGSDIATFIEIEQIVTGSGNDSVIGSAGNDNITTGAGVDRIDAGAGNDTINIGTSSPDGAADVVIFANGDGNDTILNFDAPTPNGDGTFTPIDTFDFSDLEDAQGNPVNINDAAVSNDGSGNALLTFPNGESLILVGISPATADNPFFLHAIGLPLSDGTVSGTSGDDLIDASYIGDPDGDMVDDNDAILAGDTGNDDLIEAGAGNDSIIAGDGNDEIYGGTGNDTIDGGFGDDTMFGEAGNDVFYDEGLDDTAVDTMYGGTGNDTFLIDALDVDSTEVIFGGENAGDNDTIDFSGSASEAVWLDFTGAEAGTFGAPFGGPLSSFAEIETFIGTDFNDIFDAAADTAGVTIIAGGGQDIITGGTGDDSIAAGEGADFILISDDFGNDVIDGGSGGELGGIFGGDVLDAGTLTQSVTLTYTGAESGTINNGAQTLTFSEIEDISLGAGNDTVFATSADDRIFAGAGADTIYAGDGFNNIDLGNLSPDGDADVIVLANGTYTNVVESFDGPVAAGGGLFTGIDKLDVTNLLDANGDPVNTNDVTVTDIGGGVELTFPLGEVVVLAGITFVDASNPFYLNALGIPLPDGTVEGTAGADNINAGYTGDPDGDMVDGNDAILTGDTGNDDLIYAYGGNDTVNAGYGNDEVYGGDGDDFLLPGSGEDTVFGGAGNDTLAASFGADTLYGGDGNDKINGGGWDNEIDVLYGDAGDDSISGDLGNDILYGGADNDSLFGGPGDDQIFGGTGNDYLNGGTGVDTLSAGDGNDVLFVAEGDTATGDDGDDAFTLQDLGETSNGTITIDGGSGAEGVGDTLYLNGRATLADVLAVATDDGTGSYSGTVTLTDGTILDFNEIENIICFTPGTKIATPKGARDIATLKVGDFVVTRDHGLQPIRWIQQRTVPAIGRFAPVRLRPGVVTGLETELVVSPQHRMLFQGYRAELLFGQSEVLVAAAHLVDGNIVTQDEGGDVTYIHMMFDEHEVIYAEGAATESFHPGEIGLSAVSDPAREELFAIFPQLRADVSHYGPTARRSLKRHEAELVRMR